MGCGSLIALTLKSAAGPGGRAPQILLLTPPKIFHPQDWMGTLFEGCERDSESFSLHYQRAAKRYGVHFLDTARFIHPSQIDGVHLEVPENKCLGEKVAEKVRELPL